jgi:hypothetical protein
MLCGTFRYRDYRVHAGQEKEFRYSEKYIFLKKYQTRHNILDGKVIKEIPSTPLHTHTHTDHPVKKRTGENVNDPVSFLKK